MKKKKGLDKRRKYYMVLDCETATLPFTANLSPEQRKIIAIAKPLIYDLGYTIVDKKGKIYKKKNFLISEIFSVPAIFDTAYYHDKKPLYLEKLKRGEIILKSWNEAIETMVADMEEVEAVGAYNAMFDFKKAIPFTEIYIENLYSDHFYDFMRKQEAICQDLLNGKKKDKQTTFDKDNFLLRNEKKPLFDLWGLACQYLLNCDEYRAYCKANNFYSHSKGFYSTTAEKCYSFVAENTDFIEAHTALDDAEIESFIFQKIVQKAKNKVDIGIIYFPHRIVGKVE